MVVGGIVILPIVQMRKERLREGLDQDPNGDRCSGSKKELRLVWEETSNS